MVVIGYDIGGTKCASLIANIDGDSIEILHRNEFKTVSLGPEEVMSRLYELSVSQLSSLNCGKTERIGISCGGPLDSKNGIVMSPPNLPGWDDVYIAEHFGKKFGCPAFLKNDADACALAEFHCGAGRGSKNMIFLTMGSGIGCGIVLNGRLYEGSCGMAGELGHVRLERYGCVGYGKEGSFEGFTSGNGIARIARQKATELLQMGRKASYCASYRELDSVTAKSVSISAENGNEDAIEVYAECGKFLGRGLSILVDLLNPEVIAIGGIFMRSERFIRPAMEEEMAKECLALSLKACKVVPAQLGEKIGDYGCIMAACY